MHPIGIWPATLLLPVWSLFVLGTDVVTDKNTMVRRMVPLAMDQETSLFSIGSSWQVLGPFQLGTREGSWGADPLEYVGGFKNLEYDMSASFRSSLPSNGTAKWAMYKAKQSATTPTSANVSLSIGYDNVDWDFLKVVYGWAAVQYQAWARGEIVVHGNETQHAVLYTDTIVEYYIDGVHHFGGDFYTFRKAPLVLRLTPGTHKIDIRLWRDVRAFGGINEPTIDVVVDIRKASGTLELAQDGILMADVVDGKLASPLASVALRNSGEDDVEIVDIQSSDANNTTKNPSGIVLVAGQTRPVVFNVSLPVRNTSSVSYVITYKTVGRGHKLHTLNVSQPLKKESIYSPHKITYLHPGGMVSYAMLRAPSKNATCVSGIKNTSFPIIIANHGAGLEADNPMVAHALDPVPDLCSWVMFPTGTTPWSGDDWHNWGFADIEAAVNSIPTWIKTTHWDGPGIDVNRWIMTGHSNGGQGTWYSITHRPDKLVAAAPISGYASIQKYVPYELWQPADPRRTAIISASLNSYRHEMLMENARGIPILQQHGEIDDNVPAYNSRLLSQQLFQAGTNSSYNEVSGQNHWWDTVMTTEPLKKFYREQTTSNVSIPRKIEEFSIVVGDPGDMGPKAGIRILNLEDPGQYGRLHVKGHAIKTSNVLNMEIDVAISGKPSFTVDGDDVSLSSSNSAVVLTKTKDGWQVGLLGNSNNGVSKRRGRQLGAMTAILRTRGPFTIRHQGGQTAHIALQVSRNFHQYFYADAEVVSANSSDASGSGNVITIAIGAVPASLHPNFPIQVDTGALSVRDSTGTVRKYEGGARVGAAFLRPLKDERLELVVWGSDEEGLAQAARLVPTVTGVGQPDFVILGESSRWRGLEGALALGFFGHDWEVTPSSLVS